MRFLVDECVSPRVADALNEAGHEATHVRTVALAGVDDVLILERARSDRAVIITADHDFAKMMFQRGFDRPSIIFLREDAPAPAAAIAHLLAENLEQLTAPLEAGAIVAVHASRLRVRRLPIVG